jgi:FkbM family methyltransferase
MLDAIGLAKHYNATVFSFECNPDCLDLCYENLGKAPDEIQTRLRLVPYAVSTKNKPVSFFAFDRKKYDNVGASSMYKIDFTKRDRSDADFGRENPQKEIVVQGIRVDTFLETNSIKVIDLVCMDLQGFELGALKSFGSALSGVRYILTETAVNSTYVGGACFKDVNAYLVSKGFRFVCHNHPSLDPFSTNTGVFSEFDALFENTATA